MILRRNVLGGMTAAQEKYPHIPMYVAPPLGVDDRLVAVAADRIRKFGTGKSGHPRRSRSHKASGSRVAI